MKVNFKLLEGEHNITKANLKIIVYDSSINKKYDQGVNYKKPKNLNEIINYNNT